MLSILNHDCAIAAAAARMAHAAGDRPIIEMGSRRTHEQAAVAAARAAYLAGFTSTSNLQAGATYGIPTSGTSAHAFTLLHDTEAEAFAAQVAALGVGTTLLVDTYDITAGIATAVEVAGPGPRRGPHRLRRPRGARRPGPRAAGLPGRDVDAHRRLRRPRRVRARRAGRRARRRLRRGHLAGHRVRGPHRRAGLQARRGGGAAGGEALDVEGHPGRAQGRGPPAPAHRHRHRRGPGGRVRPAARAERPAAAGPVRRRRRAGSTACPTWRPRASTCAARW